MKFRHSRSLNFLCVGNTLSKNEGGVTHVNLHRNASVESLVSSTVVVTDVLFPSIIVFTIVVVPTSRRCLVEVDVVSRTVVGNSTAREDDPEHCTDDEHEIYCSEHKIVDDLQTVTAD